MTTQGTGTMPSGGGSSGLAERASGALDEAGSAVADTASTAREELGAVVDQASQHTEHLVGEARREVVDEADRQVRRLGDNLHGVADDVVALAEGTPREGSAAITIARRSGEQIDRVARRLQEGGSQAVLADVRRFARNRPGVFLVGALGAGFVVGRLLRNGALTDVDGHGDGSGNGHGPGSARLTPSAGSTVGGTTPAAPALTGTGAANASTGGAMPPSGGTAGVPGMAPMPGSGGNHG